MAKDKLLQSMPHNQVMIVMSSMGHLGKRRSGHDVYTKQSNLLPEHATSAGLSFTQPVFALLVHLSFPCLPREECDYVDRGLGD